MKKQAAMMGAWRWLRDRSSSPENKIRRDIRDFAARNGDEIDERLRRLDREWEAERLVKTNAIAVGALGLLAGIFWSRKALVLPLLALPFMLRSESRQRPMPMLSRAGLRTRREINAERYALRALRGDFDHSGQLEDREQASLRT